jgi:hypothetical protein
MTNPAEQAAPQPEVEHEGLADERFHVHLPVSDTPGAATHVAYLRGDEAAYTEALRSFVSTGSEASAPLRLPVAETSIERVANALRGLGGAVVESIEPVDEPR